MLINQRKLQRFIPSKYTRYMVLNYMVNTSTCIYVPPFYLYPVSSARQWERTVQSHQ